MIFQIEKAAESDSDLFARIIEEVWSEMDQKEWFAADNAEYTYHMMRDGNGIGYKAVAVENGDTAAVFLVTFPGLSEENLGRDIGLSEAELMKVAHMDSAAVLPAYRGRGLQNRLMEAAERDLKGSGIRYLLCTVHPDNIYSRNNMIKQGYRSAAMAVKYGGYEREIFVKELSV